MGGNHSKAKHILKIRAYFALYIHIYIWGNSIMVSEEYPVHEQWQKIKALKSHETERILTNMCR